MKDINIRIDTKLSLIIGALVLLILGGFMAFAYKEMSNMRRDLYAVRADYYGYSSESAFESEAAYSPVETEIISQEVKKIRVFNPDVPVDKDGVMDLDQEYIVKDIREVKVKITNKDQINYSYYEGSFGITTDDGRFIRSINVYSEDNRNDFDYKTGYGLELAPGGSAEVYMYFPDYQEVTELQFIQF